MKSENTSKEPQEAPLRTEREAAARKRVPFSGHYAKLEVNDKDPNYHYYWHKDSGDTLRRALAAGYEFVDMRGQNRLAPENLNNRDLNVANHSIVGRYEINGGKDEWGREFSLVLMRQPMEFHQEDQKLRDAKSDEVDAAIRRQTHTGKAVVENAYGSAQLSTNSS